MNNKVIYTCITGNYDTVKDPTHITEGWDYICFTNNPNLKSSKWKIIQLENDENLSDVKLARKVKILPHKFLDSQYDLSIWLDANLTVACDLNEFSQHVLLKDNVLALMTHGQRDCIYDEGRECIAQKKDDPQVILDQLARYREKGFPAKYGMVQTGIEVRKHKDLKLVLFNEMWFEEVRNGSRRDQLSFNYILWVTGFNKANLFSHMVLFQQNKFPIQQHIHGW